MQQSQLTGLDQPEQQGGDQLITELPEAFDIQSLSLIRKIELWSGRLAMFGLTTMIGTIAVNAH